MFPPRLDVLPRPQRLLWDELGLTYQACDERACLPAVTKGIEIAPSV